MRRATSCPEKSTAPVPGRLIWRPSHPCPWASVRSVLAAEGLKENGATAVDSAKAVRDVSHGPDTQYGAKPSSQQEIDRL